ncbi:MAG: glutathione peroxidase [Nocardioides sp.]|uniref:glutathione peroxidase n=1 Tax=Nocardioides sp. TaxID=35761 RepID=UPI0039E3A448
MSTLHDFEAESLAGELVDLSRYRGKAVLVVNTASQCGFTPQLAGLQHLYAEYADRGLEILGFPCNQFGGQEPGDAEQIGAFCTRNYGVTFPMFAKVDVNGPDAAPVYRWLKSERRGLLGRRIGWNFTKFLVSPGGDVVGRYAPVVAPARLASRIEAVLPG